MSLRNARFVAVSALALLIALAPVAALASPRSPGEEAGAWLDRLWSGLSSLWAKDGCQILPDGRPYCPSRVEPSRPQSDVEHRPLEKASPASPAALPQHPAKTASKPRG